MAVQTPKILCSQCNVAADMPAKPTEDAELRCPECDRVDRLECAVDDARLHATHIAKRAFEKKWLESGRPLSRQTPEALPERNLRWISNHVG